MCKAARQKRSNWRARQSRTILHQSVWRNPTDITTTKTCCRTSASSIVTFRLQREPSLPLVAQFIQKSCRGTGCRKQFGGAALVGSNYIAAFLTCLVQSSAFCAELTPCTTYAHVRHRSPGTPPAGTRCTSQAQLKCHGNRVGLDHDGHEAVESAAELGALTFSTGGSRLPEGRASRARAP